MLQAFVHRVQGSSESNESLEDKQLEGLNMKRWRIYITFILCLPLFSTGQERPRSIVGMSESISDVSQSVAEQYAFDLIHQCAGLVLWIRNHPWYKDDPRFVGLLDKLTRMGLVAQNNDPERVSREAAKYAAQYQGWMMSIIDKGELVTKSLISDEVDVCVKLSNI